MKVQILYVKVQILVVKVKILDVKIQFLLDMKIHTLDASLKK